MDEVRRHVDPGSIEDNDHPVERQHRPKDAGDREEQLLAISVPRNSIEHTQNRLCLIVRPRRLDPYIHHPPHILDETTGSWRPRGMLWPVVVEIRGEARGMAVARGEPACAR